MLRGHGLCVVTEKPDRGGVFRLVSDDGDKAAVGDLRVSGGPADGEFRETAEDAIRLVLAGDEIPEGPEDRHLFSIRPGEDSQRLQHVGVRAGDQVRARFQEDLRPAALLLIRLRAVFRTPVHEDDDGVGGRGRGGDLLPHSFLVTEKMYGPGPVSLRAAEIECASSGVNAGRTVQILVMLRMEGGRLQGIDIHTAQSLFVAAP